MTRLNDPDFVRREYAAGHAHAIRLRMFDELREGPHADDVAIDAVAQLSPGNVLEVGCGDGTFAERLGAELGCDVLALDLAERAVALTSARGVKTIHGDVQQLPVASRMYDCAVAKWMLYHVPDLDRAIAELARVLRPGGRLVAVTLSEETMPALWRLLGDEHLTEVSFSRENGHQTLSRYFAHVTRHDIHNVLVFRSPEQLREYVAASMMRPHLVNRVPNFEGTLRFATRSCMFIAETAQ